MSQVEISNYPAPGFYVRVLPGRSLPEGVPIRSARDGVGSVSLPDGTWAYIDRFRDYGELEAIVRAADAGDVEVLTAAQVAALMRGE